MRVAGEIYDSLTNGPGMRYVLFTQGCSKKCEGCQNEHTWSKDGGKEMSIDEIITNIGKNPLIEGVTLSGGDPLEQSIETASLCLAIKEKFPKLNILIYTGYTLEQIRQRILKGPDHKTMFIILSNIDYLIDGRFEKDNTDGAIKYTGSANQNMYEFKNSHEEVKFRKVGKE